MTAIISALWERWYLMIGGVTKLKKIIVAEDDSIVRLDIVEMLKDAGYDVTSAVGNGEKAIELNEKEKPDLIIMDIKMPKLNGLKASKIISQRHNVPILIVSAFSQSEYIEQAKDANIVGYIIKPISESQLLTAVEIALAQSVKMSALRQESNSAKEEVENRKLIEKAKGLLMSEMKLNEEAAYQKLRKLSMNHHISMEKVAAKVIKQLTK